MKRHRLDHLARLLAMSEAGSPVSRRTLVRAAAASIVGATAIASTANAAPPTCRAIGQTCGGRTGSCCSKSTCDAKRKVCLGLAGAVCTDNTGCGTGLVCVSSACAKPQAIGKSCTTTAECAAGLTCTDGVCRGDANATCTTNAQCGRGLVCRSGKCQSMAAHGGICDENADCQANMTCINKKCKSGLGGACTSTSQCPSQHVCRADATGAKVCGKAGCTDVSCGGDNCPACASGKVCKEAGDCQSGICISGICRDCVTAADCPATGNACITATCSANTCGTSNVSSGTPVGTQTSGDCATIVCNGAGATTSQADSADTPANLDCQVGICTGSTPGYQNVADGTPCTACVGGACTCTSGSCLPV